MREPVAGNGMVARRSVSVPGAGRCVRAEPGLGPA